MEPFSNSTSSECGNSHQIQFTQKEGCTPTACACVVLAILFVTLGSAAGVYFGLQFLDLGKGNERVYKGSFVIVGGDKYTSGLADTLSDVFQEKAKAYKERLDILYRNSVYQTVFHHSDILALNRRDDKQLIVHFNLHLSPEQVGLSAADLYVILSEEVVRSKSGVFKDLEIDYDSILIQERKPPVDDALDKWVPRRQYPGYVAGLTTTPSSSIARISHRQCTNIHVPFCYMLPYNSTSYPNVVGHRNLSEAELDFVTYRQIMDFECYPLAKDFVCQLLQPDCQNGESIMPCRDFCDDFWKSCKTLLPKNVMDKIDCSTFPKFSGHETCHQKPDCSIELKARGMSDRICDGVVDCKDASDETECESCQADSFLCGDTQCVPKDRRCDLREDCWNGADERNCMSLVPDDWSLKDSFYTYSTTGLLLYSDSGEASLICAENLNSTLPAARRDVVLQSLASSTCSALHFDGTESVDIQKDTDSIPTSYVQLLDPLGSIKTFVRVSCGSQSVVHVKCGASACGLRPAFSPRSSVASVALYGQWPWHVALFRNEEYVCDATLLSDQWILTASSCVEREQQSLWTARLGIVRLSSGSPFDQESRIIGMVKSPIGRGAISLLKLESPTNGSDYVRPSCLPSRDYSTTGKPCNTLRWSVQKSHLQEVQLRITNECGDGNTRNSSASNRLICAVRNEIQEDEECQISESEGSPLLCNIDDRWHILGVSNQKVPCYQMRSFHSTYEHSQWIRHTLESL